MEFPPRYTVYVYCSTIHLNSALVFSYAQNELRHTGCVLDVHFSISSSQGVQRFVKATQENVPSLVTVTDGTAELLEQYNRKEKKKYWNFLEVQPGLLHWSSPKSSKTLSVFNRGVENLTFVYLDHPTDKLVFDEFCTTLSKTLQVDINRARMESKMIDDVPERIDLYHNTHKTEYLMTNSFLDSWALLGKPPSIIEGWKKIQRRFIFANSPLVKLLDSKGYSIAYWLQEYLAYHFENLYAVNHEFLTGLRRLGGSHLLKQGLQYLGVSH